MPKLNLNNPATADYFLQIAIHWCRLGIDGLRIDHVIGLPDNFIKRLSSVLKSINSEFILIGEACLGSIKNIYLNTLGFKGKHRIWKSKNPQLAIQQHYNGILDGVLDFNKQYHIASHISENMDDNKIEKSVSNLDSFYSADYYLPVFLDNHDMNRYYFLCKKNKEKYINALNILFSQKQPVLLYFGNEIPLAQKNVLSSKVPHSDLNVRQAMLWNIPDKSIFDHIKHLIVLKKEFHGCS